MTMYLLVIGPIAGFLLGMCVTLMLCTAASEGDRVREIDLSAAAARGELNRLREGSHPW